MAIELPFWPFTHFGTRQAALERLQFRVQNEEDLRRVGLCEVTLREAGLKFVAWDDFGSPRPDAIMGVCLGDDWDTRSAMFKGTHGEIESKVLSNLEQKLIAREFFRGTGAHLPWLTPPQHVRRHR